MRLFPFQEAAAAQIAERTCAYLSEPIYRRGRNRQIVPFFQALSAVTGAGKTAILAAVVRQISAELPIKPIVLWLSKRDAVVAQSFDNLAAGGKYNELLGGVPVNALIDYPREDAASTDSALVFVATVGTFTQESKEEGTLKIYRSDVDNMEQSVWDALRLRLDADGNRRPLVIVYDEGQNLSDLQTELLLDLDPDVIIPASATLKYPARLEADLALLRANGFSDDMLITRVPTKEVVDSGLVKPQIILEGYNTVMETAVGELVKSLRAAETDAAALKLPFRPKAIYVSDTNMRALAPGERDDPKLPFNNREAPPILIWRYLTESCDIDPADIAVYANLEVDKSSPLPEEFNLFSGKPGDFVKFQEGNYQHVIFNQRLQEGWDDPTVYFAYIDKVMLSTTKITQVIGRVLRQPGKTLYSSEPLNTAHLFVRFDKNDIFSGVVSDVQNELGAGADDGIRLVIANGKAAHRTTYPARVTAEIPESGLELKKVKEKVQKRLSDFVDFHYGHLNLVGAGSRRIVRQRVGEEADAKDWEELEFASTARIRWILQREIQRQLPSAIGVVDWGNPKLEPVIGIGSPAYASVIELARHIVDDLGKYSNLQQRRSNPYRVESILGNDVNLVRFSNSVHAGYSGLNSLELDFANALDRSGLTWMRNQDRVGYGIPLATPGPTKKFYPDFVFWSGEEVICVDTKGPHLVDATVKRKLSVIDNKGLTPALKVKFVSLGHYDDDLQRRGPSGVTVWGSDHQGVIVADHINDLDEAVTALIGN